jgi:hypothetical protein
LSSNISHGCGSDQWDDRSKKQEPAFTSYPAVKKIDILIIDEPG